MLKRIRVAGYKSLQNVEVQLNQLFVLFGPNAAGKSNFLDASLSSTLPSRGSDAKRVGELAIFLF